MKTYYAVALGILITAGYGWINNIVQIFNANDLLTGEMVLRIAGIFVAPLGAVLGYF